MLMKRVIISMAVAILLAALFVACSGGDAKKINITKIGWIDNNIATDYWSTPLDTDACAFYLFYIGYDGNIAATDIESASISVGGTTWTLADSTHRSSIHAEAKNIGGGYYYIDETPNSLPVGTATATIRLTDGHSDTYSRVLPAPGSIDVGSYTDMHTEDYVGMPPATSASMLKRATVSSFSKAGGAITVYFSISDPIAQNGDLWLFSASDEYVGVTHLFCDPATDSYDPAIVSSFNTNGMENTVSVDGGEIDFEDGFTFSSIAAFRVVLFDGKQYEPVSNVRYDSRSVSSKYSF
jgi:hypothetical protein